VAKRALAGTEKKCQEEDRTPVFVDEAGFYLLPGVVRTWAPVAETPVLNHKLTRDHLSVISAITAQGKLYMQVQEKAFTSGDCIRFLGHLQRQIAGKLLVVWDGAPIHRSNEIKRYLSEGASGRLALEPLPGYAPDLNPDEGIWHYLKHVEMANLCCPDTAVLRIELRRAKERLRHKKHIIQACFRQAGY
jgi:transposase